MSNDRFKVLSTDPRYRLPSRKEARTSVDPRFKRLFSDQDFRKKASVDRYGRQLEPQSGKKELEKLYRLDNDDKSQRDKKQSKVVEREVVGSSDESESEDGEDEVPATKRDPAREGGFSDSSSEEESSEEDDSDLDNEDELAEATAGQEQTEEIPMGEVTSRIGCVNLDWDNIRAADIMAVAASFAPADGRVESVVVYPSEFGRERMEREELEGPPREVFASSKRKDGADEDYENSEEEDDEEDDEDSKIQRQLQHAQVSEGNEFDTAALRQYQLERLRYFYAVISCSSDACAKRIYDALDGHEYLNTANFFDLRFIPDEVSFEDDKPREECSKLPEGYRPNDFRTEALTHSKVRLTWDDDDPERKEVQKRAFSRAEIDENDMQAYIGSDSSDAESVASKKSAAEDRKAKKKEAERAKMRAALGLAEEPSRSKKKDDEPVGDMQITFTSGMTNGGDKGGVFENEPQDAESTRDRYIRKERDRKQKRRERAKAARKPDAEHFDSEAQGDEATAGTEDYLGFDDPFFNDPKAAAKAEKKAKEADRLRKQATKEEDAATAVQKRAELELIMADDKDAGVRHFDMREVEKAEKEARRKGKKGKKYIIKKGEAASAPEEFDVETEDPRFKALFESHEYAIDPTNARYKRTKGMEKLREEGRKKRKVDDGEEDGEGRGKKAKQGKDAAGDNKEVEGLVARLGGKKGRS